MIARAKAMSQRNEYQFCGMMSAQTKAVTFINGSLTLPVDLRILLKAKEPVLPCSVKGKHLQ